MKLSLRNRREEAVSRHDRAFDSDPSRSTPAFRTAVKQVTVDLEDIIRNSPESESDAVELARTHLKAGQAYDDLARSGLRELIPLACAHYEEAQRLLKGTGADIDQAKVDANYANTLFSKANGNDIDLMKSAERRYEAAVNIFEANGLDVFARQVREYLHLLRGQMVLARQFARMQEGQKKLENITQQIKSADSYRAEQLVGQAHELLSSTSCLANEFVEESMQQGQEINEKYESEYLDIKASLSNLSDFTSSVRSFLHKWQSNPDPGTPTRYSNHQLVDLLQKRLEKDVKNGEVSEVHAKTLGELIGRLGKKIKSGDSPEDLLHNVGVTRVMMDEAYEHMQKRLQDELGDHGPIVRRVYGGLSKMDFEIAKTSTVGRKECEVHHELKQEMMDQLSYIRSQDLSEEAALEREGTAWSLALKAQHFFRRHHVMVIEPLWDSPPQQVRPRSLFVSGDSFASAVEATASRLGVEVLPKLASHAFAQGRWNQLRSCGVALFDFEDSDFQRAQTAYELGMALVLGVPSVVFARDEVPFDVDLPVYQLGELASDTNIIETGIIDTVFTPARVGQVDDSMALNQQTLALFERKYSAILEQRSIGSVALKMVRDASEDFCAFANAMETILRVANLAKPLVVRPAWPQYIEERREGKRVCFHVTPFNSKFNEQRDTAMRVCDTQGFRYLRHDMTKDPRIIRSLWREILNADRILVDLTDANPNVALELGLAHTIGKEVLLVAEDPVERYLFPSVRQIQTIKYTRGDNSFEDAVSRWLS